MSELSPSSDKYNQATEFQLNPDGDGMLSFCFGRYRTYERIFTYTQHLMALNEKDKFYLLLDNFREALHTYHKIAAIDRTEDDRLHLEEVKNILVQYVDSLHLPFRRFIKCVQRFSNRTIS